jgi:hypothetical protein
MQDLEAAGTPAILGMPIETASQRAARRIKSDRLPWCGLVGLVERAGSMTGRLRPVLLPGRYL